MGVFAGPDVSESGLVLALDAGNVKSYASELITNGTFDSNVTGWTTSNSTNTWSSGKMQISRSGGDGRVSYQTFATIVGQTYRVTSEVNSSGSRGDVYIYDGSGIGGTRFLSILGTNGQTLTLTGTFIAISTITTLGFGVDTNGTSIVVDNVSVSPILWTDLTGRGNSGTLTNGPTYSSANGGSIVFDGTNDYVEITDPTTFRNQNFTVSVWVNPETQTNTIVSMIDFDHGVNQGWVLQSEDAPTNRYYYLAWHDGTTFQPSGAFGVGTGVQVTTSTWQNIVYSKSGTSLLGYLNGVQVYTGTAGSANVNYSSNRNFRIGNLIAGAGREFIGRISNTQIYNRALTATEIQQNFNATRGRYGI